MNNKKTNKSKYILIPLGIIAVLILIYVIVYFCFKGEGFIYAGKDLEKRDWLSFLGTYLSFAGTIMVSLVALLDGYFYRQLSKKESNEKRKKEIQPIFSIRIKDFNTSIKGYAEAVSLSDPTKNKEHKNFTIEIENVSVYPIKHLIVFDKYIIQLLKSNEPKELQCTYEDSPDYKHKSKELIRILQSDYERTDNGLPKWFNINYEDIDGNEMYQTFKLQTFDDEQYYSLTEISDV